MFLQANALSTQGSNIILETVPIVSISNVDVKSIESNISKYSDKPSFLIGDESKKVSVASTLIGPGRKDRIVISSRTGSRTEVIVTGTDNDDENKIKECFYCRLPYKCRSLGYPVICSIINGQTVYYVKDKRICSPGCLLSHLESINLSIEEREKYKKLTWEMFEKLYKDVDSIVPADDFRVLEKNGGSMKESEWTNKNIRAKKEEDCHLISLQEHYTLYMASTSKNRRGK